MTHISLYLCKKQKNNKGAPVDHAVYHANNRNEKERLFVIDCADISKQLTGLTNLQYKTH